MAVNYSKHQRAIAEALLDQNVAVQAVAGSGKTTTVLHIAEEFRKHSNGRILMLVYNKALREETEKKVQDRGLLNVMTVKTYHGYAWTIDNSVNTDTGMINLTNAIENGSRQFTGMLPDLLILDELQDISMVFYRLVMHIIVRARLIKPDLKLCLLGDTRQAIYGFLGADTRFLTHPHISFDGHWEHMNLPVSYRLGPATAKFVNACLGREVIQTLPRAYDPKPIYVACNPYPRTQRHTTPLLFIYDHVRNDLGYYPSDIFILSPSLNKNTPVRKLANAITKLRNDKLYIPRNDEEILNDSVMKNKLCFSTFHQSKGRERQCVIVLGKDTVGTRYNDDPELMSNAMYVACTRASRQLVIVQSKGEWPRGVPIFPPAYMTREVVESTCEMMTPYHDPGESTQDLCSAGQVSGNGFGTGKSWQVTKLIKHIPSTVTYDCLQLIDKIQINDVGKHLECNEIPDVHTIQDGEHDDDNNSDTDSENDEGEAPPDLDEFSAFNKEVPAQNDTDELSDDNLCYQAHNSQQLTKCISDINEVVSDIIGTAVPMLWRYIHGSYDIKFMKKCISRKYKIMHEKGYMPWRYKEINEKLAKNINLSRAQKIKMFPVFVYIAIIQNAHSSGYVFRIKQISKYDLLSTKVVTEAMNRMDALQLVDPEFEVGIAGQNVNGIIDCVTKNAIFEFKFSGALQESHYLQAAIYSILEGSKRKCYLFNIASAELTQVNVPANSALIDMLKQAKVSTPQQSSMEQYANDVESIYGNVLDSITLN